jgi:hypothetical protein
VELAALEIDDMVVLCVAGSPRGFAGLPGPGRQDRNVMCAERQEPPLECAEERCSHPTSPERRLDRPAQHPRALPVDAGGDRAYDLSFDEGDERGLARGDRGEDLCQ